MEKLDILESLWEHFNEFKKRFERCQVIPQTLENYLISVARTGNIIFPWDHVKFLFRCKLVLALREFGDEKGIVEEVRFLNRFDNFRGAPFTIQRLTELILEPKQHNTSKEKYIRALDKCLWITSTVEDLAIQSRLEVKEGENDVEFENGCGNEGQLDNDSWLTDNDASYLKEEDLESADVKVKFNQKVKGEVENVVNCKKANIHRLSNMKMKKKIDHPARSNIDFGKPQSLLVQPPLSNLNARTYRLRPTQKCQFCHLTFQTQFVLKWHINDKHPQKQNPKQNENDAGMSCNNFFCCSGSSRNMQWKLSSENNSNCQLCDKNFGSEVGLKWSMKSHPIYKTPVKISSDDSNQKASKKKSEDRKFSCAFCQKSFKNSSALKRHEIIHTGERPFICTVCKKAFTQQSSLNRHLRTHTGERPFKCSICKTSFIQQHNLDIHLRTHTGEKPFKCSFCKKAFTLKKDLDIHLRTHTGEKPFSCTVCKQAFIRQCTLHDHLRIHTREKPFSCAICKKDFARKSALYVHFRTHTGEKPFVCSTCGKRFSQSSNLKKHSNTHTN